MGTSLKKKHCSTICCINMPHLLSFKWPYRAEVWPSIFFFVLNVINVLVALELALQILIRQNWFMYFVVFFSSSLQPTTLIGLCPTLYHRADPMLLSHQVRNNPLTHAYPYSTFPCPEHCIRLVNHKETHMKDRKLWVVLGTIRPVFSLPSGIGWGIVSSGLILTFVWVYVWTCGVNICNCYSGAYNNAGLVSVGGVITANVPPPPYTSTHKVAGMIRACVCVCDSI